MNSSRAAGLATLVGAGMMAFYAVLFTVLTPTAVNYIELGCSLALATGLACSGFRTIRMQERGLWVSMILVGFILAVQLWAAYTGQHRSHLSLYMLTVPLVLLIINTRALSALKKQEAPTG
jgi:hypothetical protein